jgi:hypothetical protein
MHHLQVKEIEQEEQQNHRAKMGALHPRDQ